MHLSKSVGLEIIWNAHADDETLNAYPVSYETQISAHSAWSRYRGHLSIQVVDWTVQCT